MSHSAQTNSDGLSEAFQSALALHRGGRFAEAEAAYRQVLEVDKSHIGAWQGAAALFEQSGRGDLAADSYGELGRVLLEAGRIQDAWQSLHKCLELNREHPAAHAHLSLILWEWNRLDEAAEHAQWVVDRNPDDALAWQTLGLVACRRLKHGEAMDALGRALSLQPDLVLAHNYLGVCFNQLGRFREALAHYEATLRVQPANPHAHFNRALIWLSQARFPDGWVEYEWRFNTGSTLRPAIPRAQWDGSPLDGKALLIHTEQGMGDVLQFVRLLPLLKAQGARIVFACHKPLQPLLARCEGIDEWFPIDEPGPINFDLKIPLLSLPGLLKIDDQSCPKSVPYVFPDPERVATWRERIAAVDGFKVGICWQGSPTYIGDPLRSIPLEHFAALAEVPGVALFGLQKGHGVEQLHAFRDAWPIHVLEGLDESGGAMMDTAAVMQHLDLVVTSDTAIAHLAGALGRPVWVALSTAADWRWFRDRSDSPWYATMRLFRQNTLGDWPPVFAEMAAALQSLVTPHLTATTSFNPEPTATAPQQTVTIEVAPGEVIDKITILEIKQARITHDAKLRNIRQELVTLNPHQERLFAACPDVLHHAAELKSINEQLWDVEDHIRVCERSQDFGEPFVELARSVYRLNDRRASVKRTINLLCGSPIMEEKSYENHGDVGV